MINIKEERIDAEDEDAASALSTLFTPIKTPDSDTVEPETLQQILRLLPPDALEIRQSTREPNWELGDPCPVCGNERLSAMTVTEDIYI